MLFYYALAAPGSSFIRRFKVQAEFLWAEFLVNVCLRAARILLVVYAHHVTSKSRDVRIYARVVHFNSLCNGCDRGKDASRIAALWQTLCISNSVGRRLMCASMTSIAMVCRVPEMVVMAIRCMDSSHFVTPTDPIALVPCIVHITGAYHMSAAYVNLGTATTQYSCLMNLYLMPVDGFVR